MIPRKRFGQHFLQDGAVIQRIVDTIDPQPGQHVVEIGPGLGAITLPLLARHGSLDAVEVDRDAIAELKRRCVGQALRIHSADALQFDFAALAAEQGSSPLRLVGNLPYNISTPLLFHLLTQLPAIHDMHFMLQKEVVQRMAATPGSKVYGRLTVMLAPHVRVESLFDIPPQAFRPPPKVVSTFLRMTPHRQAPFALPDTTAYARVVAAAFAQRRKTLRNALQALLSDQDIAAAGVDPSLRAEVIPPAGYAALALRYVQRNTR
jgi:16S rRNA (adenine1518-N6/adenine1519-N6)-dimethyltransferase